MPNRILREGILSSERVAKLPWPAEVFYRRLMSVVDDFGRYFAKPELLRSAAYPLQHDKVGNPDIVKWLTECVDAGLVRTYAVSGKEYLELCDFRQQVRAQQSKFPQMPINGESSATHPLSNAHLDVVVVEDVCGDGDDITPARKKRSQPKAEGFADFYAAYPRKVGPQDAEKAWQKLNPDAALRATIMAALELQKQSKSWNDKQFIPHPATWLNKARWLDEVPRETAQTQQDRAAQEWLGRQPVVSA